MEKKIVFQVREDFVETISCLPFCRLTPFYAFWANLWVFKTNKVQEKFNYLLPEKIKILQPLPLYHSSFQDSNFSTALELAVRFGKTLVIQEMDGVEPVLFPILRGDFISQGEDRRLLLAW